MNELAKQCKDDGQVRRAVMNYLGETFIGIKDYKDFFEGYVFENENDFLSFISDTCNLMQRMNYGDEITELQTEILELKK